MSNPTGTEYWPTWVGPSFFVSPKGLRKWWVIVLGSVQRAAQYCSYQWMIAIQAISQWDKSRFMWNYVTTFASIRHNGTPARNMHWTVSRFCGRGWLPLEQNHTRFVLKHKGENRSIVIFFMPAGWPEDTTVDVSSVVCILNRVSASWSPSLPEALRILCV